MMSNKEFCVFILTHGRPERVFTYNTLRKHGYTGKIYIVIDDEDKTSNQYYELYGEQVLMFSKYDIAKKFDEGDNFNDRRAIIYARNSCFELAKKVNCTYFMQLDDDYTDFRYRFNDKNEFASCKYINNLDKIIDLMLEYYISINSLSIAMAQCGDFIGGRDGVNVKYWLAGKKNRKCMNTFICSVDRPFYFVGRINEDVNTYILLGSRGYLFLTIPIVMINQKATQSNKGGMTELYLDSGTFIKSFYTVMYNPSCVKVFEMPSKHKRLHHKVKWSNAVPCIIDERYKIT